MRGKPASVPLVDSGKPSAFRLTLPFLQQLQEREIRDTRGLYFVEGLRFAIAALARNLPIMGYAYSPELLARSNHGGILKRLAQYEGLRLSSAEFATIRFAPEPQGIILVLKQCLGSLAALKLRRGSTYLGLESIRTLGNLGTMLRTAQASGTTGIMLFSNGGQSLDPFEPQVLRASMGAGVEIPLIRTTYRELRDWSYRSEIRVVGADPGGPIDFRKVRFRRNVLIMVGEERNGISTGQRSACDALVHIPMARGVDSLNVAMATTLLLFEAYRQKHPV